MKKDNLIRPSAENKYAVELDYLAKNDKLPKPDGWRLSPKAVLIYLMGGVQPDGTIIEAKYVGDKKILELCLATLLTDRGLLLMGLPGTAKSWLSEHIAAAVSGISTTLIQGTVGTDENSLRYHWNYAELLQKGPSINALVKSPVLEAMEKGLICRIEELTRMPTEIQDILITVLSEKVLPVPELGIEVFARKGFNVIATANDRDKGVHDLSAALRRRFNIVYMEMPETLDAELEIIRFRLKQIQKELNLDQFQIPLEPLKEIVTIFRELRNGKTEDKQTKIKSPGSTLSTAELLSVIQTGIQHAVHFGSGSLTPDDIASSIVSTIVKDKTNDLPAWEEYLETNIKNRKNWRAWYDAFRTVPV